MEKVVEGLEETKGWRHFQFIEKLNVSNPKVIDLMVMSWKDRKVKIDGVDFQVREGIIAEPPLPRESNYLGTS